MYLFQVLIGAKTAVFYILYPDQMLKFKISLIYTPIGGYINIMKKKSQKASTRRTKKEIISELSPISLFVRIRREELGYTQNELAFRAGLSTRFIKEFELGKKTARLDKVTDLLNYLGASLEVKQKGASNV
jgi:DNA-binding XRE family transcriptional regulator